MTRKENMPHSDQEEAVYYHQSCERIVVICHITIRWSKIHLGQMGAFENFVDIIRKTEAMQEILKNLVEEPAKLLTSICEEYEDTDKPVPDHHLLLVGQTGETAVKVLLSATMITRETGQFSLYSYKPTELGLTYYKKMRAEQTRPEKQPEVV